MHAQAIQRPSQGGVIATAAIWGGLVVVAHVIVLVVVAIDEGPGELIVWSIVFGVLGVLAIGLGAALPGMGKGISLLAIAVVMLVLWLVESLTMDVPSIPGVGRVHAEIQVAAVLITLLTMMVIVFGSSVVIQRDYPRSVPGRVLGIVASLPLGLVTVLAIIICSRLVLTDAEEVAIPATVILVVLLWMLAVVIVGRVNVRKSGASRGARLFVLLGLHVVLGVLVLFLFVGTIILCVAGETAWPLLLFLVFAVSLSPVYLGSVGLGDMIRQIHFKRGQAPVPREKAWPTAAVAPAQAVAAPQAASLEQRLGNLKHLFENGQISQEEYNSRREQMLGEL